VNQRLSLNRAVSVRNALLAASPGLAGAQITAKGYGKLMPVACADNPADNEKNRRVEAWVR
jgi:outer membrane protein OmpA-like peptidoglycan-associated protein